MDDINKNINFAIEKVNLKDAERKRLEKEKQDLYGEYKDAENHLNNYQEGKQKLIDELGEEAGYHPSVMFKSLHEQQQQSSVTITQKEEKSQLNKQEMDEKREFVTSQRIVIGNKTQEMASLKAEHAKFEKEKNNLLSLLSDDGKNTINIFEDMQEFLRYYQYSKVEAEQK